MVDRDLIAEGRRLLAAAGPYRWTVEGPSANGVHYVGAFVVAEEPSELLGEIAHAEHIVHMHNTCGQLLDELEQARARIDFLESERDQNVIIAEAVVEQLDKLAGPAVIREARAYSRQVEAQRDKAHARITELETERDAANIDLAEAHLTARMSTARIAELEQRTVPTGSDWAKANRDSLRALRDNVLAALGERPTAEADAELAAARARITELEAAANRMPVGYITAYRTPESDWSIEFDGAPFATPDDARADLLDAADHCLPGLECRTLTLYDEEGD